MPARRKAASFVEGFAQRSLAYLKGTAQGGNVQRLVYVRESQSLRLFDKIAARVTSLIERRFLDGCEPLINIHWTPPKLHNGTVPAGRSTPRRALARYCPLGQIGDFSTLRRNTKM